MSSVLPPKKGNDRMSLEHDDNEQSLVLFDVCTEQQLVGPFCSYGHLLLT